MIQLNEKLIDVIIPVYNKLEYIDRLFIELKKLPEYKCNIIFIDDGSTDLSYEKIKSNIDNSENSNIFLFFKENGGVSSARNKGLEYVKSKYIWFFDPDDMVGNDVIKIFNYEFNSDVIVLNYDIVNYKTNNVKKRKFKLYGEFDGNYFLNNYNYFSNDNDMSYIWNKIYKKDLIEGLKFNERKSISEDREFNLRVFSKNVNVLIINLTLYRYFQYNDNTLSTTLNLEKVNQIYDTNILNLDKTVANRRSIKKHIISQSSMRFKCGEKNVWIFYKNEHKKFRINIFPLLNFKEIVLFVLIYLNLYNIVGK